jgi:hypothetical protein
LSLHEAPQVVRIAGAGWIACVCHGLSRVVSFGGIKERTAVLTVPRIIDASPVPSPCRKEFCRVTLLIYQYVATASLS